MTIGAIIPARGGSKGIPGKNLKLVGGHPLVGRSILAALGCSRIDTVAVSTDCDSIADVSRQYGAQVIRRPEDISGDSAKSEDAVLHTVQHWNSVGYYPDFILLLQCTSALTSSQDLDDLIEYTLSQQADSAFTGYASHRFLWTQDASGEWVGVNHQKNTRLLRQQRPPEITENGAAYLMKTQGFLTARHRFFGKTVCWELPSFHAIEIDDNTDLDMVRFLSDQLTQQKKKHLLPSKLDAIAFDFDGVFTNNKVYIAQSGEEIVECSRGDGLAIARFKKVFPGSLLVISTELNEVVAKRCQKLDLPFIQGLTNKEEAFKQWLFEKNIPASNVIFVGNDLNDLGCMKMVGCPVAVADAHPEVVAIAKITLSRNGGNDAVREILNLTSTDSEIFY